MKMETWTSRVIALSFGCQSFQCQYKLADPVLWSVSFDKLPDGS